MAANDEAASGLGGFITTWGSTAREREVPFPCDHHLPDADTALYRAVDVAAPPPLLFRWLCQLRAAPYSYDWIDNLGRRSPRHLTPGLEALQIGQRVMTIFSLVDFETDRHLTLLMRGSAFFGTVAGTYRIIPRDEGCCRLVVKLLVRYPRAPIQGFLARTLLPTGDLIMMRKQLMTLKHLAERDAQCSVSAHQAGGG
jgi:hypothetical protein